MIISKHIYPDKEYIIENYKQIQIKTSQDILKEIIGNCDLTINILAGYILECELLYKITTKLCRITQQVTINKQSKLMFFCGVKIEVFEQVLLNNSNVLVLTNTLEIEDASQECDLTDFIKQNLFNTN